MFTQSAAVHSGNGNQLVWKGIYYLDSIHILKLFNLIHFLCPSLDTAACNAIVLWACPSLCVVLRFL